MFFPLRTDRPLRSTPYVNYALILLNVVVFILQQAEAASPSFPIRLGLNKFALAPNDLHLLHFVTYAFLHGGWMHLIGNMVFLFIFGNSVSDKMGQLGYLLFYLAGAIFAGVGYVLLSTPIMGGYIPPVVGASGAISAVTGAFLVLFPNTRITIFYFWLVIGTYEVPALLLVPFFFLQDVFFNFVGGKESGVAHVAHIAGTVFGVVIALILAGGRLLPRDQFDMWGWITRWNKRRQYRAAVATGWDPYGNLPPKPGDPPRSGMRIGPATLDPRQQEILELRAQVAEAVAQRRLAGPKGAVELYLLLRQADSTQVMSRTAQLDIANQLAEEGRFAEAAEAYELFLKTYADSEQHAHIELLTGIIYSRYLNEKAKAAAKLEHAMTKLTNAREIELARGELAVIKGVVS